MQPTIYYSLLTSAVTRSLKGESDPILEKLDLSNGFIGPDELKSIAKCVHQYAVNKESQSTLNSIVLSRNQLCGINVFGVGEYDNSVSMSSLFSFFLTFLLFRVSMLFVLKCIQVYT